MRPDPRFAQQPPSFWATVKLVSEGLGYSIRTKGGLPQLRQFTIAQCGAFMTRMDLHAHHLLANGVATVYGDVLCNYLNYRANVLHEIVEPALMNRDQARAEFERLRHALTPRCPLPMNKQKGDKKHHSFLVGVVNMLTEQALQGRPFNGSPGGLAVITRDGLPLRTLSRRMDGAYPDILNPHALWEVKEYYGTTTFGSRVADGVYETMLDGFELAELNEHEHRKVLHYLIVDDHFTWWVKGRSYLCRLVDMLHMGLVDEILFGREVLSRWPEIVRSWA